jgi:hypothetical protein
MNMDLQLLDTLQQFFRTVTEIFISGIAITAFALLIFSFYYNLRDRVIRAFTLIMGCVVIVYSTEAFALVATVAWQKELLLKLQWVGIVLLPAIYFHFSDALLATTGKPSRWKRKWTIRITYLFSIAFLALLPANLLVGKLVEGKILADYLEPTIWTTFFVLYYLATMVLTWFNFLRTYKRAATKASKRRMAYLLIGATAPALGSFPFLLFSTSLASQHTLLFWIVSAISNFLVAGLLVIMAYAVSFFGVTWPDRVIKTRLTRWLMRGPFTAVVVLGLTTLVRRAGESLGIPYTGWVPITMVITVLLMEYVITLAGPFMQRWLFYGNDQTDLEMLQTMENGLLTRADLRQFFEMTLGAVCDILQAKGAGVIALEKGELELIAQTGELPPIKLNMISDELKHQVEAKEKFIIGKFLYYPLRDGRHNGNHDLLGWIVVSGLSRFEMNEEQERTIAVLVDRTGMALRDRINQEQIFKALENLTPQIEMIQQLRAAGRYNRSGVIKGNQQMIRQNMNRWVKDALDHYWGGPKLSESPLLQLQVIRDSLGQNEENPTNALRAVFKVAIEKMRPEGERKYTSEWILYNLLDLKFLEGKKVREIARRLAISEADLYRKQRIAIQEVSKIILEMEMQVA